MLKSLEELYNIITVLRSENGCPWDREQTIHSLDKLFLEECFELSEAIQLNNIKEIEEELGDVTFMLFLLSYIAHQDSICDLPTVYQQAKEKLIFRHPHIFNDKKEVSAEEVKQNWEMLKKKEKQDRTSLFDGIPKSLPDMMRFDKLMRKLSNAQEDLSHYKDSQIENKKSQLKNLLIEYYQEGANLPNLIKEINLDIEHKARNKGL